MRKLSLIAGVLVATLSVAGASSAFAAVCLNPAAGSLNLTHNLMSTNNGYEFDLDGYNAEMAKGNVCPQVTQQSVSNDQVQDYKPHAGGKKNGSASYN